IWARVGYCLALLGDAEGAGAGGVLLAAPDADGLAERVAVAGPLALQPPSSPAATAPKLAAPAFNAQRRERCSMFSSSFEPTWFMPKGRNTFKCPCPLAFAVIAARRSSA